MNDSNSQIFVGLVSSSDAATYTTQIEVIGGTGFKSPQTGVPLAGVFATTMGVKECIQYPVGAQVLCFSTGYNTCYILGIIPPNDIADLQFPSRVALMTADGMYDKQNTVGYNSESTKSVSFNQNRPTDLVD